ncbi:MAG TPA: TIGR03016 family PEP-CTERM system-associated outer membrane protein [Steroidobacteraceae bacterium]|nr:TIGR03016 family PEP-CTERM system-associated outer membrane protein [Steroidobacteraceae bacterium]
MSKHVSYRPLALLARGLIAVGGLLLLGIPAAEAQTTYTVHLGAAAGWTDNIDLSPPGVTSDAEIWQLLPGIHVKHDGQDLQATLDYELQGYQYSGSQHGHDIYQSGNLYGEGTLLRDWLYVDAGAAADQSVANPIVPASVGLLYPTGNIVDQTSASAAPVLRHKFAWFQLEASYKWGFVRYKPVGTVDEQLWDASNQDGSFKLSSPDPKADLTWDALYNRQETTYTEIVAPRWLYELAQADLGWLVAPTVRLLAQGGTETDLSRSVVDGGLSSPFWLGGFDWSAGPRDELRFLAGHRFFGKTFEGSLRHQSRLLTLQVSYSETPTTGANRAMPQVLSESLVVIPGTPPLGIPRVTPDAYVLKKLDARAALTGRLTEIGVKVSSMEASYLTLNGAPAPISSSDRIRAATLYVSRRMGANVQGSLRATFDHDDLREGFTQTYNDRLYSLNLSDQISLHTMLTLAAMHTDRYGAQRYRVNLITLTLNMSFGNTPGGFPSVTPAAPGAMPAGTGY